MNTYHKIQTVFKRDEKTKKIIHGDYSMPEFEFLKDNVWIFTEKVDGTNTRVMWNGDRIIFGGKSEDAQIPVHLLYKLQELFEGTVKRQIFIEVFGKEPVEVCLYGEGYGNKNEKRATPILEEIARNEGYAEGYKKAQQMIDSVSLYNKDALKATKQFYANGYLNALQDCKEILRKQWDEEWIDYANPLPDIIKIIESLENEKK